jgi:glycosyltransferase involved in cell wall biosynthesis
MRYLLVLPVPFFPLDGGRAAVESAFALHLQELLASLGPKVTAIDVLAPAMDAARYEAAQGSLQVLDAAADRIAFAPAFPLGRGRLAHLLGLPRLLARIWRAVGRARFVHAGPSQLFTPFENLALAIGWLRRRKTVYVVDIDHRQSARMNLATGAWSRGVAFRRRHLHDRWFALQHHLARWSCSTLFLKGRALVRDFGRGRGHVHQILDCAHSAELVLPAQAQEEKCRRLAAGHGLRACYFGRLVAYKGIDRMLRAVHAARARGAQVTFDVFGDGDQLGTLRALATELQLDAAVRFLGSRPYGPEFFAELAGYDVLLAAPLSEDTPRSAIDAQALGIAVLAFDTYYYRDLAEQGAGVAVVPWPDTDALGDAMVQLAADRVRLVELARASFAFAAANTQEVWLRRRAGWTPGVR